MRPALAALLPLTLAAAGCAEPFTVERHRLGPPRIAALGVFGGVAQAAVWSGRGLFHDEPVVWRWTLDGEPIGDGPTAVIPPGSALGAELGLEVEVEGAPLVARLSLAPDPEPFTVAREQVELGEGLEVRDRLSRASTPVDATVEDGAAARLVVIGRGDRALRWMLAGEHGDLLELDADRCDLLRDGIDYDGGALLRGERGPAGVYTALVLAIDGRGGDRWRWVDVGMGVSDPLVTHRERRIALVGDVPDVDVVEVILVRDDAAGPLGMRVEVQGPAVGAPPPSQPCAEGGRLSFDAVAEGRCTRAELDGQRLWLELR